MSDLVNHPSHYKQGRVEAIDVIEDVVSAAPEPVVGFLVGNALKYLLRAWHKENTVQDLQKAEWYLRRAIARLNAADS
tara:strand:+ start:180 stop:413 length:234 start_codon:yes stop_codon:yes gene_type:complete